VSGYHCTEKCFFIFYISGDPHNETQYISHVRQWKMDMRFGIWNVGFLYRPVLLKTVVDELEKFDLHILAVQDVRWGNYIFTCCFVWV
jgi:hypothetical protein